ncbi:hypothetical protein EDD53_0878 [Pacificibacter maritimus]|uniref:Uncharacterized protein n=1 Tax=Pacificibacter maritimus TaxID=762213 RepID=A0A3N4VD22_9RHOB|nr:hypothetical protein [Pacificibacter maritimus]RPE71750.1 hypothetical protein EDD53_0878 [Pacificibacter maritimus]
MTVTHIWTIAAGLFLTCVAASFAPNEAHEMQGTFTSATLIK